MTIARTDRHWGSALFIVLMLLTHGAPARAAAPVPQERTLYRDAPNGMYLLDAGWTTRADPRNVGQRERWFRPGARARFTHVSIPNAFNAHDLSRRSFSGRVQWYRTTFTAPHVDGLTQWRVRFESVNVDATVWLNGKKIGHHRGAFLPFELRVQSSQMRSGGNELVVRVDSRGRPSDLQPSNRPRGWWNFGGILREVYLRAVRTFDLSDLYVQGTPGDPSHARIRANLRNMSSSSLPAAVTVHLSGPGIDTTTVVDPGTTAPGQAKQIDTTIDMPGAQLWTPKQPTLYELTVDAPGGQRTTAHFGVRRWSVGPNGRILLNGVPLVLRGASFHEQTAAHGAALTPADRATIVDELKALGANFTRAHYPPHPALLEAFDRAGIVYWEQVPVWRVRDTQLRNTRYRNTALAALRNAILRDRNHASGLAWSVSNETLRAGTGELTYIKAARALTNKLDPERLLAADDSLLPVDRLPASYRLLDAVGLDDYVGWYGGRIRQLSADLRGVHRKFPHQALVVTEFGAEANRAGPSTRKGTYAFQQRFLASHLAVYDRTPFLSGALAWVLRDFVVRPGWTGGNPHPRPPFLFKGLFRRDGSAKPAVAMIRQRFANALASSP